MLIWGSAWLSIELSQIKSQDTDAIAQSGSIVEYSIVYYITVWYSIGLAQRLVEGRERELSVVPGARGSWRRWETRTRIQALTSVRPLPFI